MLFGWQLHLHYQFLSVRKKGLKLTVDDVMALWDEYAFD